MYTLFLDSSDKYMAAGISNDKEIIAHFFIEAWQKQSELFTDELADLLYKNNIAIDDISKIVVGIGPGSYTGVRIALTIAKVMAFSKNIPLYTVSSLAIMADFDLTSICVINARSNRSYVGVYKNGEALVSDQIMQNEDLLKYIDEHRDYSLCGDLSHIKKTGEMRNPIFTMFKMEKTLTNKVSPLTVKPVYMKD